MQYNSPVIVAEIGCNHRGEMETAKSMIKELVDFCKVPVVKFQKRSPRELLSAEEYNAPHPNPMHSYGLTYGKHREYLEFSIEQHAEMKLYCEELGIIYSSSVWDMTSAREVVALSPNFIKVPSAMNTHKEMLLYLCDEYSGQIHISIGMSTQKEIDALVELIDKRCRAKDAVLYACTSAYPVPFEDVKLLDISDMIAQYGTIIGAFGFSGHHNGIAIDIAAYTLGATWIERHFTLNRTWKGTDHAASLEPDGMRRLVRNLDATYKALDRKSGKLLEIELEQREKLKFRDKKNAKDI
jgi:sialic acid synthase SpsE